MARPYKQASTVLDTFQHSQGTIPEIISLLQPPLGHHPDKYPQLIGRAQLKYAYNVRVRNGSYKVRDGLSVVGVAAVGDMIGACQFILSDGSAYIFRFLTTKVQVWDGTTWEDVTGLPTLTASTESIATVAAWDDKLLFSNGIDGTYAIDPTTLVGTELTGSSPARQLSVFAGRVFICGTDTDPNLMLWCVKNDYNDWAGEGSGNESFKSTPGGVMDSLTGLYPVSDNQAFIVRSNSIWVTGLTGYPDTPFIFTRAYTNVGSDSPNGVVIVDDAIIVPGRSDVWKIQLGAKPQPIGGDARQFMLSSISNTRHMCGVWDPNWKTYSLFVPGPTTSRQVHVCHMAENDQNQWTTLTYPFDIRALAFGRLDQVLLVDQLSGLVDNLSGLVDALGVTTGQTGLMFVPADSNSYLIVEDSSHTDDANGKDVMSSGVRTTSGFELQSGSILPTSPLDRVTINDEQLLLRSGRDVEVSVALSDDGGSTWEQEQTIEIAASSIPRMVRYTSYAERDSLVVRVKSEDCGNLDILLADLAAITGARVNP